MHCLCSTRRYIHSSFPFMLLYIHHTIIFHRMISRFRCYCRRHCCRAATATATTIVEKTSSQRRTTKRNGKTRKNSPAFRACNGIFILFHILCIFCPFPYVIIWRRQWWWWFLCLFATVVVAAMMVRWWRWCWRHCLCVDKRKWFTCMNVSLSWLNWERERKRAETNNFIRNNRKTLIFH